MGKSYEGLYLINSSTLEEVCQDYELGFPYFAGISRPDFFPDGQYPWHWHKYVQCFYVIKGEIDYILPSGTYRFRKGDGGFINSNALHMLKTRPDMESAYVEQLFYPTFFGGVAQNTIMTKYVDPIVNNASFDIFCLRQDDPDQDEMLHLIKRAFQIYTEKKECYELQLLMELTRFWKIFYLRTKNYRDHLSQSSVSTRIKPMLLYISENYGDKITLEQIASAGSCSTRECNRLFKANLHTTPFEYLSKIRMKRAIYMLTNSSYSITHISESCGFSDPSHFTKSFKKIYKVSPKQYRAGNTSENDQILTLIE